MDFLILGPIEVRNASATLALGGIKPRAVLAVLLLHANEPVSAERLALALWGEDAPGGAVKTVQVHVSRLRKALGDAEVVTTTPAGYCLRVQAGELDAERFERLVEDARRVLADGRPEDAAATLREALALWRGPALAELSVEPFAAAEIGRLEEQRLSALELRVEADLAAGRHAEVVGELQQLVDDNPLREQLAGQLMLALYRCGRQTEALEVYARARRVLVEEVGIEPGPQLRELHEAILRQDVALQARPGEAELPPALDPASARPLVGRDEELAWLSARWELVRTGGGSLVALTGERGVGKSRLTAELARAVHGPGVAVVHTTGEGPADSILVALRRVREATRPTLLVIDDVDRAGAGVGTELERLAPRLAAAPVLVVVCAQDALALAHLRPGDTLELGPLDARAVCAIAASYAPGKAAADVPAEWLVQASGAIPRRVHELASQWARREAARHVGVVAGRAELGRAELRSIEAELAGGVVELQETREHVAPREDAAPVVCPFKGLASYDIADTRYFFGRERLVAELVARLVGAPLLGVVGPSGSGKSSVLRAGLLPALAGGVLPGSEDWALALMRPGEHPLQRLGAALADLPDDGRVVIAVDQFEETFTACADEDERAEFVAELVHAAADRNGRYVVVLALRADYYGRCAAYPELSALLAASNVLVGSMRRDELRRAVEGPCARAGLRIEAPLTEALLADVEREPGGLPLMSTALLELWQRRDGRRLRHRVYEQMGGVRGAVARLAEDAYDQLDAGQQVVARGVLMRLVGSGDGDAVERRRVALDDLEIDRDVNVGRVVALLTDRRLLTVSAGSVELAHEALLREWPRLAGWIEEDRDGLRIQRALSIAAQEWERLDQDDGALLRGSRLTEAVQWRDAQGPSLNQRERRFLEAAEAAGEHERATRRRRTRLVLGAAGIAILATVAVAVVALFAARERGLSASRDIAGQSAAAVVADPGLARAFAREALDRAQTPQAEAALRQATLADRVTAVAQAHDGEAFTVDASADGSMVVSGGDDGRVRLWRTGGLRAVRTLVTRPDRVGSAVFSPDGEHVASASRDGAVVLSETVSGRTRTLHKFPGGEGERGWRIDMAAGVVAVGTTAGAVWMLPTAEGAKPSVLGRHPAPSAVDVVVASSPDGKKVFSADNEGRAFIWDAASGSSIPVRARAPVYAVSFSPDAKHAATAGDDGHVQIWSAATGALVNDLTLGDKQLFSVQFSADSRHVVTAGEEHVVQIADVASGQELSRMAGGSAVRAVFTTKGKVASAGADGKVQEWAPLEVRAPSTPAGTVTAPSFGGDREQVVSGDLDGGVQLWDPAKGERALPGHADPSYTAQSPDGSLVMSVSEDETARAYDVRRGTPVALDLPDVAYYAVAVSDGGRIAVAGDADARDAYPIVVQEVDGRGRMQLKGHTGEIVALDFSPDGTHLISGSNDGTARIWDLETGRGRTLAADSESVRWVSYSADNERVATAGADGTIRLWPVAGGDPVLLVGHEGPLNTAEFNRRGDRIVSTGLDGTVRVWDAAGGDTLVVLFRHRGTDGTGAAFSADGRHVVSSGRDGLRLTRCEVCGSIGAVRRLARTRALRPLSASERERLSIRR